MNPFGNPALFDLLNEMDGMAEDADVAFLLTTNRVDLLEPALAARPGRVDLAVEIGPPDEEAQRRLIELFGRGGALKSSWYGDCLPTRDFPMLIDLYLSGQLDLDGFVSETIGIDEVEEAFHKMERGEVLRSVVVL